MLKKAICILFFACFVFLTAGHGFTAVTVTPSSISVAQGQASTITLQYQFTGVVSGVAPVSVITSSNGIFNTTSNSIGTNPVPMSVNIIQGKGNASEVLVIPAAIVERARAMGLATFMYQRTFASPTGEISSVQIRIASESTASFNVKRIELYFDNKRAEITVQK